LKRVLHLFPELIHRLDQSAATLSGGERQLLSLALCFMLPATILLLDEPTIGLSPPVRQRLLQVVRTRVTEQGMACVLVEQRLRDGLSIADSALILRRGRLTFSGPATEVTDDVLRRVFL
jgi:branched-chain amino acid transport system ATP-binding protein